MRRNVEFGTGTEFELLDAQNNYYAARRAYSQTRYDYLTNVLTLKQQAGRLTEQDLVAIDDFSSRARMSMRLLPKEPVMLRDTSAQDRVIEPQESFQAPSQAHHRRAGRGRGARHADRLS